MTEEEKSVIRDVVSTLNYVDQELDYELTFRSGKLDVCRIYIAQTLKKATDLLESETAEDADIPF